MTDDEIKSVLEEETDTGTETSPVNDGKPESDVPEQIQEQEEEQQEEQQEEESEYADYPGDADKVEDDFPKEGEDPQKWLKERLARKDRQIQQMQAQYEAQMKQLQVQPQMNQPMSKPTDNSEKILVDGQYYTESQLIAIAQQQPEHLPRVLAELKKHEAQKFRGEIKSELESFRREQLTQSQLQEVSREYEEKFSKEFPECFNADGIINIDHPVIKLATDIWVSNPSLHNLPNGDYLCAVQAAQQLRTMKKQQQLAAAQQKKAVQKVYVEPNGRRRERAMPSKGKRSINANDPAVSQIANMLGQTPEDFLKGA